MQQTEEEVNLLELINVLARRKGLVFGILALSVLAGLAVSLSMTKYYSASAVIRNGSIGEAKVNGDELLDMPVLRASDAESYIKSRELLGQALDSIGMRLDYDKLEAFRKKRVKVSPVKNTLYVLLEAETTDPDSSLRLVQALTASYIAHGNELYDKQFSQLQTQAQQLDRQIEAVDKDISNFRSSRSGVVQLDGQKNIVLQNPLPQLQTAMKEFIAERIKMQMVLGRAKNFQIIDKPQRPLSPSKPRKKFILGLFLAGGLALSVAAAFIAEATAKKS